MKDNQMYDLLGIGLGPFNLSLAALLGHVNKLAVKFCDNKSEFRWHPELMFGDATMQTSYLKDLVTPVDPTNPYSFLNYLVHNGLLYHFINTDRKAITRFEFEDYCKWVSKELGSLIDFNSKIENIEHKEDHFVVSKKDGQYLAKHLCIASGPTPNIPECVEPFLGDKLFHAKSRQMQQCQMTGKRVLIVGGGQTGVEIFRNSLKERWGKTETIHIITGRENLIPLEEGPFTNEVFTPEFVSKFHSLPQQNKDHFTERLLLASDGNTPDYLQDLYRELYLDKFYTKTYSPYQISPMRWLEKIETNGNSYCATIANTLTGSKETIEADLIILATGFRSKLPNFMEGIRNKIQFDEQGRPLTMRDYKLKSDFGENQVFAMNYSRHGHGIADPQTSLMSWRSAVIANSVLGENFFRNHEAESSFLSFFK